MLKKLNQNFFLLHFWRKAIIISIFLWSAIILISLYWNIQAIKRNNQNLLIEKARTHLIKDYAFRNWATKHSGLYAYVDSTTQPNPYLAHVPERDIVTPSGKKLTLINAAYMMRQIYEQNLLGLVKAHLTSLKPIRPENAPDPWEVQALIKFEQGAKEYYEFTTLNGQPYLRLMRPMKVEKSCLSCHAYQGYKIGDIRGGLSVSLPLAHSLAVEKAQINSVIFSHSLFWLLGVFIIAVIGVISKRYIKERELAQEQLKASEALYRQLIEVTPQTTFVYDMNGIVLFCSQSAKLLLEAKSIDEIIGHSIFENIHPDSIPIIKRRLEKLQNRGQIDNIEEKIITSKGNIKYVEASSIKIQFQNQPAILSVVKDITEQKRAQQALIESELKYRETMNAALVGIYIVQDFKFKYVNPQMTRYLGYEPEELVNKVNPIELVVPAQQALIRKNLERLSGVNGKPYEIKIQRKDGSVFDALVLGKEITIQGKRMIVGTLVDITKQKENARKLNEQLKFARAMNRISEKIIAEDDPKDILQSITGIAGETLKADRAFIFSSSFSKREIKMITKWLSPNLQTDPPIPERFDIKMFENYIALLPKDQQTMENRYEKINSILQKDKQYTELLEQYNIKSLLWYPIGFHEDGFDVLVFNQVSQRRAWSKNELEFITGLSKQVNIGLIKIRLLEQLKKSEQALREKEEHYRTLFELSPYGILLEDKNGFILDINKSLLRSHGYKKEDLIGKHISILAHPDEKPNVKKHIQQLLNGEVLIHEVKDIRKDGSVRNIKLYEKKITLPSGEPGILCIAHDITEAHLAKKEKDQLQQQLLQAQKMESIGKLAGGIAHDFNNLLTVINGHAELLALKLGDNEKLKKDVAAILQAGQKAANMTQQLLTFSRKEMIQPKILDLNQVIHDMEKMLRRLISEDIAIKIQLDENIPRIKADPGQLEQVLMNLIVNARDAIKEKTSHTEKNQIEITTDALYLARDFLQKYPSYDNGWYVRLTISDSGVGMTQETIQNIFDPFFTTKAKGRGTGLGLSTVYGIIHQNKGIIEVESVFGKGSKFIIYWPAEYAAELEPYPPKILNKQYKGNESILLVEDEKSVRDFAIAALKTNGYHVQQAANGIEALNIVLANNTKFDLIITDIIMPEMDGKRMAKELQKNHINCKILFTTGYTDSLEEIDLPENKWKLLRKPYSIMELTRSVRELLDN